MERKGRLLMIVDQRRKPTRGRDIAKLLKDRGVPIGEDKDRDGRDSG